MLGPAKQPYAKPALTPDQIIQFLQAKGLNIQDEAFARQTLANIGYFRLKIYSRPFEDAAKRFVAGTTFQNVVDRYEFDRALRLMFLDAIERIEVSLRSTLIEAMCAVGGGPHFYRDPQYFDPVMAPQKTGRDICLQLAAQPSKHPPIVHYKQKYDPPPTPPIWSLLDISTIGELSRIFSSLKMPYRKLVSKPVGMPEPVLVSWTKCLTTLRNTCAHHQRLWNASMVVNAPAKWQAYTAYLNDNRRVYSRAIVVLILLNTMRGSEAGAWAKALAALIDAAPASVASTMGFPFNWKNRPLWTTALA